MTFRDTADKSGKVSGFTHVAAEEMTFCTHVDVTGFCVRAVALSSCGVENDEDVGEQRAPHCRYGSVSLQRMTMLLRWVRENRKKQTNECVIKKIKKGQLQFSYFFPPKEIIHVGIGPTSEHAVVVDQGVLVGVCHGVARRGEFPVKGDKKIDGLKKRAKEESERELNVQF